MADENQQDPNWIQKALDVVKDDHIQQNKHRLGLLGSQDIDRIQWMLEQQLSKEQGNGNGS